MVVQQYDIVLVILDPALGHKIKKSRPCVVVSPDEMNQHIATVIIAPMTTKSHSYPTRVPLTFKGKHGRIVLDQIRTVDKARLIKKLGRVQSDTIQQVKTILREMLVD